MKNQLIRTTSLVGLAIVILTGCSNTASNTSVSPTAIAPSRATSSASTTAANNEQAELVNAFYTQAFIDHDYQEAANTYLAENYIQHSPGAGNGKEGFVTAMQGFIDPNPELSIKTLRTYSQGDLVFLHNEITIAPGVAPISSMDIFRVSNGKIVEHWDAQQQVPAESANGNTMFDGPTESADQSQEVLDRNTASALDFLDLAFNQAKAQEAVDLYVGDEYIQHNPGVADGAQAFVEAFAGAEPLTGDAATKFPRTIAQGDFVVVQTFASTGEGTAGSGSIDIFRFDSNGKIVEHWDAVQDYPAETVSGNTVWDDGQ